MDKASSDAIVAIVSAVAVISTNIVIIIQMLRLHGKQAELTTSVNGRMSNLIDEVRGNATMTERARGIPAAAVVIHTDPPA